MAPPPLVFDFIGIVFEAILYGKYLFNTVQNVSWALCHLGLYCLIYGLYWRIQLRRADRWKGVLLYALTANFILCTAYFIINIIQVQFFISVSSYLQDILLFSSRFPGVQLIFESIDRSGEWKFIDTCCSMDDHCKQCTIYRHRFHFRINIGERY